MSELLWLHTIKNPCITNVRVILTPIIFNSTLEVLARKLQSASRPSIRSMAIHFRFVGLHFTAF